MNGGSRLEAGMIRPARPARSEAGTSAVRLNSCTALRLFPAGAMRPGRVRRDARGGIGILRGSMETPKSHAQYLDALLTRHLTAFLGDVRARGHRTAASTHAVGGTARRPGADVAGRAGRRDVPDGQRPAAHLHRRRGRHAAHGARDRARPGRRRDEPVHRRTPLGHAGGDPRHGAGAPGQGRVQAVAGRQRPAVDRADAPDHPAPAVRGFPIGDGPPRRHRPAADQRRRGAHRLRGDCWPRACGRSAGLR